MTSKVNQRLGTEVLQPSQISSFPWPALSPEAANQTTRTRTAADSDLLDRAIANIAFDEERFTAAVKQLPVHMKLLHLLSHRAFNFNGVQNVRQDPENERYLRACTEAGIKIRIVIPLVCKINNPGKRLSLVNMTDGERAIIRFYRCLSRIARRLYAPGLQVIVLSDATLYNGALQVPQPTARKFMRAFHELIEEEQAGESVEIHDYAALLEPYWREFEVLYNGYYKELVDAPQTMLNAELLGSLPTSVRSSINTRRMGLKYQELQSLFGPDQTKFLMVRSSIDQMAIFALQEQLAIKMACDHLNLPRILWPNHLRASCHRGFKSGVAVMGLRCYPEYYGSSKLLPYHGMPLIDSDKNGVPKLVVEPEVSLRGREDLVRVTDASGDPVLYLAENL